MGRVPPPQRQVAVEFMTVPLPRCHLDLRVSRAMAEVASRRRDGKLGLEPGAYPSAASTGSPGQPKAPWH
jgi:hypothetical protein